MQMLNKFLRTLPEKSSKKTVIPQHDNARTRTARLTLQTIRKNGWELLSHPGCEELERTSTAEAFLRFCNAGRNA
jgi:hypothetical protein